MSALLACLGSLGSQCATRSLSPVHREGAVHKAADAYDMKHEKLLERASRSLHRLDLQCTDEGAIQRFQAGMFAMRANRLNVQPVRLGQVALRKPWGAKQVDPPRGKGCAP